MKIGAAFWSPSLRLFTFFLGGVSFQLHKSGSSSNADAVYYEQAGASLLKYLQEVSEIELGPFFHFSSANSHALAFVSPQAMSSGQLGGIQPGATLLMRFETRMVLVQVLEVRCCLFLIAISCSFAPI